MRLTPALVAACLLVAGCASGQAGDGTAVSRSGDSVLVDGSSSTSATASSNEATQATQATGAETEADADASASRAVRVECATAPPSRTTLQDLTAATGLDQQLLGLRGHAFAAGDVDGDGDVDVFVGGFADRPIDSYQVRGADGPSPDVVLLRDGDGWVADPTFPEVFGRSSGAAFADLDGDGDLDLVIARNPRDGERASAPSEVMINDGGRFTRSTVLDASRGLRSIGVLDFDGDGLLDLFLVEDRFRGGDSRLLRNLGGMAFEDATAAAGLPSGLAGLGVAAVDLDRSGTPDLFIGGANRLFVNVGGSFEEVEGPFDWELFGDEDDVAGVAVGDLNADGWLDLVVGQHFNSTLDQQRDVAVRAYLHRGLDADGRPVFEDMTESFGLVGLPTKAPHVEIVDVDGNGHVDIVTSASADSGDVPAVFYHQGTSPPSFAAPTGLGAAQYWVAGGTFDSDGDGAPEFFAVEWEPSVGSRLYGFPNSGGGFATVRLGVTGAAGVGAVVEVFDAGSDALIGTVPIVASAGYGSGVPPIAHIGLGGRAEVDLRIVLPWARGVIEVPGVAAGSSVVADLDGSHACLG